jgi:hypothetical protein
MRRTGDGEGADAPHKRRPIALSVTDLAIRNRFPRFRAQQSPAKADPDTEPRESLP